MPTQLDKVLYTAKAHTTGGRANGYSETNDKRLSVKIGSPNELGGTNDSGTNPEQLFAAGYSACFLGAIKVVAGRQKIIVPENSSIDAKVSLGPVGEAFGISVELNISLPGMDKTVAQKLVDDAHQVCPYSNATRGNIPVDLKVNV